MNKNLIYIIFLGSMVFAFDSGGYVEVDVGYNAANGEYEDYNDDGFTIRAAYYFYSKLSDLKIDMIAKATKDATLRAKQIAKNANTDLGSLISAQMGVFQIIAKNSTENYTWGGAHNKTSKHKTATVTMKLSYNL